MIGLKRSHLYLNFCCLQISYYHKFHLSFHLLPICTESFLPLHCCRPLIFLFLIHLCLIIFLEIWNSAIKNDNDLIFFKILEQMIHLKEKIANNFIEIFVATSLKLWPFELMACLVFQFLIYFGFPNEFIVDISSINSNRDIEDRILSCYELI